MARNILESSKKTSVMDKENSSGTKGENMRVVGCGVNNQGLDTT